MLSYAIFIFGAAAWKPFPEWLLTETGAMVYSSYLDILAGPAAGGAGLGAAGAALGGAAPGGSAST